MITRSQKIRLGAFLLVSGALLLGAIVTLAGLKLWNPKDRYLVHYQESISGLEVGSTVKMKGVRVGQVEHIEIGKDVETIIVRLALRPGTPVTVDTRAILKSIGITGMQFVELTGGTAASARIPPNRPDSKIQPGASTLQTLTGQATSIALKFEAVMNNLLDLTGEENRVRFKSLLRNTDKLVVAWERLARENEPRINRILANVAKVSSSLQKTAAALAEVAETSRGNVGKTLGAVEQAAQALRKTAEGLRPQVALRSVTGAADAIRRRVDDPSLTRAVRSFSDAVVGMARLVDELKRLVGQRDQQLAGVLRNLDRTSADMKQFARAIRERPSLLIRGDTGAKREVP